MLIATASLDGTARIWDATETRNAGESRAVPQLAARSSRNIARLVGHQGALLSVAFSPDSQRVVTTSSDGTARVWSTSAQSYALTGDVGEGSGRADMAEFSEDGTRMLTVEGRIKLWDVGPAGIVYSKDQLEKYGPGIKFAAFSKDGTRIVTASEAEL